MSPIHCVANGHFMMILHTYVYGAHYNIGTQGTHIYSRRLPELGLKLRYEKINMR